MTDEPRRYKKSLKQKATIEDVVNIVNRSIAHHIERRHPEVRRQARWLWLRQFFRRKRAAQ